MINIGKVEVDKVTMRSQHLIALFLLCACLLHAEMEGLASWYGGKFHGQPTASGEIYDAGKLTAAHKSLPFGTLVRVVNLENGNSIVVRINDRGPFVAGRIIDLSQAAAATLGITGKGVAPVRLELVEGGNPPQGSMEDKAPADGGILIQVGAFRERPNAERALQRLQQGGFQAQLETSPGGILRVVLPQVGEQALPNTLEELKRLGFGEPLVRR